MSEVTPESPRRERSPLSGALLLLLTVPELLFFDKRLFRDASEYGFVLQGVSGVLSGHPVSKSWQQRFLGPWLVSLLGSFVSPLSALQLFHGALVGLANLLLFGVLRRRGASVALALFGVAVFGLVHMAYCYRLEYPWDGIDVLLFVCFGYLAARGASLAKCWPLLLVGLLNHETILYLPFWYLLAPLDAHAGAQRRPRALFEALLAALALAGGIWLLREHFYGGPPPVQPGQTLEVVTPLLANHLHAAHNLRMLLIEDWQHGKAGLAASVLGLIALLLASILRKKQVRAAVWTLCVFVSIVYFGYVNETRHYLLLIAFWFAYAWPVEPAAASASPRPAPDPGR